MVTSFEADYEVCNCQNVQLKDITDAILNKGATTLGKIQEITKAGTECRCCMFEESDTSKLKKKLYCKDILKYYKDLNG